MNWDQIAGDWEHFRGNVKEKWAHITDDDMATVQGKRGKFLDLLQVRCKLDKADAERELNELLRTMEPAPASVPRLAGMPHHPPGN